MTSLTYLTLTVVVLAAVAILCLPVLRTTPGAPVLWTGAALVAMTAVFDAAIVGFGLTVYDESLILGVRVGPSPIEDFGYTLAAVMIVPTLWTVLGRSRRGHGPASRREPPAAPAVESGDRSDPTDGGA